MVSNFEGIKPRKLMICDKRGYNRYDNGVRVCA